MEFSINPQKMFGLSFSVPAEVTDKHLKLAGAAQIKVLLWLLRHAAENPTMDELCKALNMKSADATDAMHYWVECGIVLQNGKAPEDNYDMKEGFFGVLPDIEIEQYPNAVD